MEIFIFIIGLFFGSFFGVLIDRIPKGKKVVGGRSKCDFCKKDIRWYDLIPVVSFVVLRGRCRYCKHKLSYFYPIIEILTGALFVFSYINFSGLGFISFFYYLLILSSLLVIFFMDLKYRIIPDRIVFPSAVIAILYSAFFENSFLNHFLSGIGAFLFFFSVSYIFFFATKKEGMGGGDIKLSFLLGAFLGFPKIFTGLYIAFLTAAFVSIILVIWKKMRFRKDAIPFGPFLIIGAIISLVFGDQIYSAFLNYLGF